MSATVLYSLFKIINTNHLSSWCNALQVFYLGSRQVKTHSHTLFFDFTRCWLFLVSVSNHHQQHHQLPISIQDCTEIFWTKRTFNYFLFRWKAYKVCFGRDSQGDIWMVLSSRNEAFGNTVISGGHRFNYFGENQIQSWTDAAVSIASFFLIYAWTRSMKQLLIHAIHIMDKKFGSS